MQKVKFILAPDQSRVYLSYKYDPSVNEVVKTVPGRRWNPDVKAWSVPVEMLDETCSRILSRGVARVDQMSLKAVARAVNDPERGRAAVLARMHERDAKRAADYMADPATLSRRPGLWDSAWDLYEAEPTRWVVMVPGPAWAELWFAYDRDLKDAIKALPGARFVKGDRTAAGARDMQPSWRVPMPLAAAAAKAIRAFGRDLPPSCIAVTNHVLHNLRAVEELRSSPRGQRLLAGYAARNGGIDWLGGEVPTFADEATWRAQALSDALEGKVRAERQRVLVSADDLSSAINVPDFELSKLDEKTRDWVSDVVTHYDFATEPLAHQVEGVAYGLTRDCVLIADDMGLGKTKQAIDIVDIRASLGQIERCLVVCGVNSVKRNWVREIEVHSGAGVRLIDQQGSDRRVRAIQDWLSSTDRYAVINVEALRNQSVTDALVQGISDSLVQAVILDEAHKVKNGEAQQTKGLRRLEPTYRLALTGTPVMNKLEDAYEVMAWLGLERRSFRDFKAAYGTRSAGYHDLDDLAARLGQGMIRRKKEEVLRLPDKMHVTRYVELTGEQADLYEKARKKAVSDWTGGKETNPLTAILRMRQATAGLGLDGPGAKLELVRDLLADEIIPSGQKAIVFSQWKTVAEKALSVLSDLGCAFVTGDIPMADRQEQIDRFQDDPSCKVMIGTIGALGTGVTLTAASNVIFLDKDWVPANNEQAEDRAHRIGTSGTVTVVSVVAQETADESVEEMLAEKADLIDEFMSGADDMQSSKNDRVFGDLVRFTKEERAAAQEKKERNRKILEETRRKAVTREDGTASVDLVAAPAT